MSPTEICKSVSHHVSYLCFTMLCIIHAGIDITCQSLRASVYTVCQLIQSISDQGQAFHMPSCVCHTNASIVLVSHRSMYDVHA